MEEHQEVTLEHIRAFARAHSASTSDVVDASLDRWLNEWVPALQARPIDLMNTNDGRRRVLQVMQCGAYGVYL